MKEKIKRIGRKTFKYTIYSLLLIIVLLVGGIGYLYFSADMLTPQHTFSTTKKVIRTDSLHLRQYGNDFLKQSQSGLWELKVTGEAYQRGEAIGQLSSDLLYYQEKVFVDQIREIVPSDSYLKFLRFFIVLFNRDLGKNVIEEYRNEIYGIAQSCTHEYDFIGTPYERQLNYHSAHDLGHAMQDYMLVGCSSFATWGKHSADSTLIIGRNFDFYMGDAFARNKLVSFYEPAEGYKFASIGWPGMIGVLSGMNEKGLTVTINASKSDMPTQSATPISILTREILQYASNIDEAYAIAEKRKTFVSESILIGSVKDGRAAIIEKSPENTALFEGDGQQQIICTNHYQSPSFAQDERNIENIKTSDSPYRFDRLTELLKENHPINVAKTAAILRDTKGLNDIELGMANEMAINQFIAHHSVIFQPEKLLMWVSTSPWQCGEYVAYDLNRIFNDSLNFRQEICSSELTISADDFLQEPEFKQLLIYKKLTPLLQKRIQWIRKHANKGQKILGEQEKVDQRALRIYEASNPSLYYVNEVLGDYYQATGETGKAIEYWKKALDRPIPKQQERERILQKIKKQQS